jgi:hypothetical protein
MEDIRIDVAGDSFVNGTGDESALGRATHAGGLRSSTCSRHWPATRHTPGGAA